MEVRYQVFLSSTYEDLQEERAEAMQALLELDCMPAGMELFPAASEEQWKWIQRVIEESDYYVVIIAGKYGSTHPETELSYTEMEYDYAVSIGKPTIGFVLDKSVKLPEDKIELDPEIREKLDNFKISVQKRLCKFWENTPDLGAKLSRSITQLIKREPATGWVRADAFKQLESEENLRLRNRILELERSLAAERVSTGTDSGEIARGADPYTIRINVYYTALVTGPSGTPKKETKRIDSIDIETSWDEISTAIAPALLSKAKRQYVRECLLGYFTSNIDIENIKATHLIPDETEIEFLVLRQRLEEIKIQFMALGLIRVTETEEPTKSGALSGFMQRRTEYWEPTEEGFRHFVRKMAVIKKD